MPAVGTKKCNGCGQYVHPDYDDCYFGRTVIYCWPCYEAQEQYAHTLKFYEPDGDNRTVMFDDEFIFWDSADMFDLPFPSPIKDVRYHRTDAWRGHYDVEFEDGWRLVSDGWATGWPDQTVEYKVPFNDLIEGLTRGILIPPVEFVVVYCHTSNVFSVGVDVAVREQDYDSLMDWLGHLDCDLEEALS